jgi:hypothetical protein
MKNGVSYREMVHSHKLSEFTLAGEKVIGEDDDVKEGEK